MPPPAWRQQALPERARINPSPGGEGWGEGSPAHPCLEAPRTTGAPPLFTLSKGRGRSRPRHSVRGPRLVRLPPPTSVAALPILRGAPLFTLSKGRGRSRPRHSVRGPPRTQAWNHQEPPEGRPLFTLSKGRGRFGRLRPKSVRGLPRTQPWENANASETACG